MPLLELPRTPHVEDPNPPPALKCQKLRGRQPRRLAFCRGRARRSRGRSRPRAHPRGRAGPERGNPPRSPAPPCLALLPLLG